MLLLTWRYETASATVHDTGADRAANLSSKSQEARARRDTLFCYVSGKSVRAERLNRLGQKARPGAGEETIRAFFAHSAGDVRDCNAVFPQPDSPYLSSFVCAYLKD